MGFSKVKAGGDPDQTQCIVDGGHFHVFIVYYMEEAFIYLFIQKYLWSIYSARYYVYDYK